MRAMILKQPGTRLEAVDLPPLQPGPGQVRVKVRACAVCRTDLHVVDGDLTDPKLPIIPGHEIVGVVTQLGPGVGRHGIGDRVGIPWLGMDLRTVRILPVGPGESLCAGPVHRVYVERWLRRGGRGPRALLLSHPPGVLGCEGGPPFVCRPHRLSVAGHGRSGTASGSLRVRSGGPYRRSGRPSPGQKRLRLHPSRRWDGAGLRPFPGSGLGRGLATEAAAPSGCRRHLRSGWVRWCRWRSKPWAREERWSAVEST